MIGKAALAFVASPLLVSASPQPAMMIVDVPQVRQVLCDTVRGTAFRTGRFAYVTARHVAHNPGCTIDGEPIQVTWESEELDMAVIRTRIEGDPLEIDCTGFKDGNGYVAIGYARGRPWQQAVFVVYSSAMDEGLPAWGRFKTLIGDRFIPGQSGGIVATKDGTVVGVVNGYNQGAPLSYSLPLSETPLCQHS